MSLIRRFAAVLVALFIATYPLALERCRTACIDNAPATDARSAHACHDTDDDSGPSVSPAPRACGHTDEARVGDIAGVAPSKVRSELPSTVVVVFAFSLMSARAEAASPPGCPRSATFNTHRTLPLRL